MPKQSDETKFAVIQEQLKYIRGELTDFKTNYVTKEELKPISKVVYGLVGLILTMVSGAVVALVLVK